MGNLKLNILTIDGKELQAKRLDPNDPKVKAIIDQAIIEQQRILKLKYVSRESLRSEITI